MAIAAVLYIAFNVWFYFFATSSGLKTNPVVTIAEKIKSFGGLRPDQSPKSSLPKSPAAPPTPFPTPLPRPTGPGVYACDPYGQCNLYSDEMRQGCPATFADSRCLDSCGDPAKRCPK